MLSRIIPCAYFFFSGYSTFLVLYFLHVSCIDFAAGKIFQSSEKPRAEGRFSFYIPETLT